MPKIKIKFHSCVIIFVAFCTNNKISLFELMSLNKCFVTARLITFMITDIFVDGFNMVP